MKKFVLPVVTATLVAALFASCASSSGLEGKKPVMNSGSPEIIDYQGKALGSEIPGWVVAVGEGATKRVAKGLDIDLKEETIFILQNKGNDLDFLKTWTDQVDARAEVSSSIEQTIGQTVQAELDLKQADEQTKNKAAKIYSGTMTNVTLNGLTKEGSYWIKTRTPKTGVKKAKLDSDYDVEYTYYVVYGIDKALYDKQISAAIRNIDDNDNQTEFLKDVLTTRLTQSVLLPEGATATDLD
ncbi:MAG: hypothetical protein SOT46_09095 [Treponema sp.]|nr:hypothetical protein [Spirochaetia bacterium]MDY2840508.1 hypothetical protein [Treponema sp.]